ncbi:CPBP family intramembrane glutamic endopeptidase [Eupransor demetentiae]|uniref:CAAX protease family (YdiL) n=1 Tax=Eupransor demetentiae TaxID=3109584 RepID=A0ABM9N6B4_9LACO|nr:CAAX protease family (YdiL) [Lactobacillaceae bacterium LMG 33000]
MNNTTKNEGNLFVQILIFIAYLLWYLVIFAVFQASVLSGLEVGKAVTALVISAALTWWFSYQITKSIRKVQPDFQFKFNNLLNGRNLLMLLVILIAMNAVNIGITLAENHILGLASTGTTSNQAFLDYLSSAQGMQSLVLSTIFYVLLAPVAEELLYRGLFLAYFDRFNAFWIGPVLSALIFTFGHWTNSSSVLKMFLDAGTYLVMGLVLAFLYKKTGKLSNSVAVHGVNNLLSQVFSHML